MQAAAYWVALVNLVAVPPFLLFWFFVHPFTRHWRKLGPTKAYSLLAAILALMMLVISHFRAPLLRVHFGPSYPLVAPAIILFVASLAIGIMHTRRLGPAALLGFPQLSPRAYPGTLATDGIYAYLRHPRYLQVGLGLAAIALFTNYLASYLIAAAYLPVIYLVVLLEERELRQRFGQQYEEYARRVPRFLPRFARRSR
jgi:protein-S-isoprenylcysteine O-methyltransferase Ste14